MCMDSGGTLPHYPTFGQNPDFSLEPAPETVCKGSVKNPEHLFSILDAQNEVTIWKYPSMVRIILFLMIKYPSKMILSRRKRRNYWAIRKGYCILPSPPTTQQ